MTQRVNQVAKLAGVSVRTLHHYDRLGLLRPSSIGANGYRLYAQQDLERLQQILFFRELGFALADIGRILESPSFDRRGALENHRTLLLERQQHLATLLRSVDRSIEALERGPPMDQAQMFEGFDETQMESYRQEARERWGAEKVDESTRRVAKYSKQEQARIQAETHAINVAIAGMMDRDPVCAEVQEQVGRWYQLINTYYYTCTPEIFGGLGDLYVEDERFRAFYEKVAPGLAEFLQPAMKRYAEHLMEAGNP